MGVNIQALGSPTPVNNVVAPQAKKPLQGHSTPPTNGVHISKTIISTETASIPSRPSQQSKSILQATTNRDHPTSDTGEKVNPSKN
jgi:hypothetical protein